MKKRTLYGVSDLPEWIEIAEKLDSEYNLDPYYWITVDSNHEIVSNRFKGVIAHKHKDLSKDIPHHKYSNIELALDEKILMDFLFHEKIAIKMMDRQDPYDAFTYHQRKRLYYNQLKYWLYVLKEESIEVAIFTVAPHFASSYICYAVCKYYNIETVFFSAISIQGLLYTNRSIGDVPSIETNVKEQELNIVKDVIQQYVAQNSGSNIEKPWYIANHEKKLTERIQAYKKTFFKQQLLVKLLRFAPGFIKVTDKILKTNYMSLKNVSSTAFIQKGVLPENSKIEVAELRKIVNEGRLKVEKRKNNYVSYYKKIDYNIPYLFFALHYQPEKSTSPQGVFFVDQLLVIEMVSKALPNGWKLLVKEHPTQFMHLHAFMGRTDEFYDDIAKLDNVDIVDPSVSTSELVLRSKAVVTITGSAGFESVLKGVPSLIFGQAWYIGIAGAFAVRNNGDLKIAIDKLVEGFEIDKVEIDKYLERISACCFRAYISSGSRKSTDISYDVNMQQLLNGIVSALSLSSIK